VPKGEDEFSLVLRRVAIGTYRVNVAYLHRDCVIYRAEAFQALSKIEGARQRPAESSPH
jgi:thymidine phosphorylase